MNRQYSYNWIKEYAKLKVSASEFASEFSLKSQTVDRVKNLVKGLDSVVVGKMLGIKKHPDADRLHVAKVDIGKKEPLELIFGQIAELKVGDQIAIAVAPTILPTGMEINAVKMRGIVSQGMCCLDSELGLSNYDRVTFFPPEIKPGTPIIKALSLSGYLLDIEITSNRPDAMSVVGLAREAAAVFNIEFTYKVSKPDLKIKDKKSLEIKIEEPKLCPRYQGVVMSNVKIGPSPLWLQLRLLSAGLRPINNVVDITNYILLEYGKPLHVFDYDKLQGGKIIVRQAKNGEKVLALDGNTYELRPQHLVIADTKGPVAIGGVMGGEESAAVGTTTTIVFESATFDPVAIRKTARELNLHSESSDLFEKGIHPESIQPSILRAIELTQKLAGGQVASNIIDARHDKYAPTKIKFDTDDVARHLGVEIPLAQVKKILTNLGFAVSGAKILNIVVPWWREGDVVTSHDIIEEVARIYGYHNLPTQLPEGQIPVRPLNQLFFWEDKTKNFLAGLGFTEVYNYSMVSESVLGKTHFGVEHAVKIFNPLNETMEYMRTTQLPQILNNVANNLNNFSEIRIFELSNIYIETKISQLPQESPVLTGVVVSEENPFLEVKGVVELLLKKMGVSNYQFKLTDLTCPLWQQNQALDIYIDKGYVGQFGLVSQKILNNFDIKKTVGVFDIDFFKLAGIASTVRRYQPIPEFPGVERDLAVVIDQKITWQEIIKLVRQTGKLIVGIEYLSTFVDSSLGKDKKSLAFRIIFRSSDKTLKSEEVDQEVAKIIKKLQQSFKAKLR